MWGEGRRVSEQNATRAMEKKLQLFRETVTQSNKMEFIRNFPANAFQKPDSLWE